MKSVRAAAPPPLMVERGSPDVCVSCEDNTEETAPSKKSCVSDKVSFDNDGNSTYTSVTVVAPDKPGQLVAVSNFFQGHGLHIVSCTAENKEVLECGTADHPPRRVKKFVGQFKVTDGDGHQVGSQQALRDLQNELHTFLEHSDMVSPLSRASTASSISSPRTHNTSHSVTMQRHLSLEAHPILLSQSDDECEGWGGCSKSDTIATIMSSPVRFIHQDADLKAAKAVMKKYNISSLLVDTNSGEPGIVTKRSFLMVPFSSSLKTVLVKDVMTQPVVKVSVSQTIEECSQVLAQRCFRRLIVYDPSIQASEGNSLAPYVGIVCDNDIFRYLGAQENSRCKDAEPEQVASPRLSSEASSVAQVEHAEAQADISSKVSSKGEGSQATSDTSSLPSKLSCEAGEASQLATSMDRLKCAAALWELDFSEIELVRKIGQGSFGEVLLGNFRGTKVAVKRVRGFDSVEDMGTPPSIKASPETQIVFRQFFEREIQILASIRHPNVVNFIGACHTPPNVCLVTEYCARGSLDYLLHKTKATLDLIKKVEFAMDVARGMICLHSQKPIIIHRDLKTANLLVSARYEVKVADFGLSRIKDHATMVTSRAGMEGTVEYCAPEVLRGEPYSEKCDVWSYGVVLWEMLNRKRPHADAENPTFLLMMFLGNGSIRLPPVPPEVASVGMSSIVDKCLQWLPHDRPSFAEVLHDLEAEYKALRASQRSAEAARNARSKEETPSAPVTPRRTPFANTEEEATTPSKQSATSRDSKGPFMQSDAVTHSNISNISSLAEVQWTSQNLTGDTSNGTSQNTSEGRSQGQADPGRSRRPSRPARSKSMPMPASWWDDIDFAEAESPRTRRETAPQLPSITPSTPLPHAIPEHHPLAQPTSSPSPYQPPPAKHTASEPLHTSLPSPDNSPQSVTAQPHTPATLTSALSGNSCTDAHHRTSLPPSSPFSSHASPQASAQVSPFAPQNGTPNSAGNRVSQFKNQPPQFVSPASSTSSSHSPSPFAQMVHGININMNGSREPSKQAVVDDVQSGAEVSLNLGLKPIQTPPLNLNPVQASPFAVLHAAPTLSPNSDDTSHISHSPEPIPALRTASADFAQKSRHASTAVQGSTAPGQSPFSVPGSTTPVGAHVEPSHAGPTTGHTTPRATGPRRPVPSQTSTSPFAQTSQPAHPTSPFAQTSQPAHPTSPFAQTSQPAHPTSPFAQTSQPAHPTSPFPRNAQPSQPTSPFAPSAATAASPSPSPQQTTTPASPFAKRVSTMQQPTSPFAPKSQPPPTSPFMSQAQSGPNSASQPTPQLVSHQVSAQLSQQVSQQVSQQGAQQLTPWRISQQASHALSPVPVSQAPPQVLQQVSQQVTPRRISQQTSNALSPVPVSQASPQVSQQVTPRRISQQTSNALSPVAVSQPPSHLAQQPVQAQSPFTKHLQYPPQQEPPLQQQQQHTSPFAPSSVQQMQTSTSPFMQSPCQPHSAPTQPQITSPFLQSAQQPTPAVHTAHTQGVSYEARGALAGLTQAAGQLPGSQQGTPEYMQPTQATAQQSQYPIQVHTQPPSVQLNTLSPAVQTPGLQFDPHLPSLPLNIPHSAHDSLSSFTSAQLSSSSESYIHNLLPRPESVYSGSASDSARSGMQSSSSKSFANASSTQLSLTSPTAFSAAPTVTAEVAQLAPSGLGTLPNTAQHPSSPFVAQPGAQPPQAAVLAAPPLLTPLALSLELLQQSPLLQPTEQVLLDHGSLSHGTQAPAATLLSSTAIPSLSHTAQPAPATLLSPTPVLHTHPAATVLPSTATAVLPAQPTAVVLQRIPTHLQAITTHEPPLLSTHHDVPPSVVPTSFALTSPASFASFFDHPPTRARTPDPIMAPATRRPRRQSYCASSSTDFSVQAPRPRRLSYTMPTAAVSTPSLADLLASAAAGATAAASGATFQHGRQQVQLPTSQNLRQQMQLPSSNTFPDLQLPSSNPFPAVTVDANTLATADAHDRFSQPQHQQRAVPQVYSPVSVATPDMQQLSAGLLQQVEYAPLQQSSLGSLQGRETQQQLSVLQLQQQHQQQLMQQHVQETLEQAQQQQLQQQQQQLMQHHVQEKLEQAKQEQQQLMQQQVQETLEQAQQQRQQHQQQQLIQHHVQGKLEQAKQQQQQLMQQHVQETLGQAHQQQLQRQQQQQQQLIQQQQQQFIQQQVHEKLQQAQQQQQLQQHQQQLQQQQQLQRQVVQQQIQQLQQQAVQQQQLQQQLQQQQLQTQLQQKRLEHIFAASSAMPSVSSVSTVNITVPSPTQEAPITVQNTVTAAVPAAGAIPVAGAVPVVGAGPVVGAMTGQFPSNSSATRPRQRRLSYTSPSSVTPPPSSRPRRQSYSISPLSSTFPIDENVQHQSFPPTHAFRPSELLAQPPAAGTVAPMAHPAATEPSTPPQTYTVSFSSPISPDAEDPPSRVDAPGSPAPGSPFAAQLSQQVGSTQLSPFATVQTPSAASERAPSLGRSLGGNAHSDSASSIHEQYYSPFATIMTQQPLSSLASSFHSSQALASGHLQPILTSTEPSLHELTESSGSNPRTSGSVPGASSSSAEAYTAAVNVNNMAAGGDAWSELVNPSSVVMSLGAGIAMLDVQSPGATAGNHFPASLSSGGMPYGTSVAQEYATTFPQYGMDPQQYGASAQQYGASSQHYGTSAHQHGTTAQQHGTSAQQYGTSDQQHGTSAQQYGTNGQQHGTSAQQYGQQYDAANHDISALIELVSATDDGTGGSNALAKWAGGASNPAAGADIAADISRWQRSSSVEEVSRPVLEQITSLSFNLRNMQGEGPPTDTTTVSPSRMGGGPMATPGQDAHPSRPASSRPGSFQSSGTANTSSAGGTTLDSATSAWRDFVSAPDLMGVSQPSGYLNGRGSADAAISAAMDSIASNLHAQHASTSTSSSHSAHGTDASSELEASLSLARRTRRFSYPVVSPFAAAAAAAFPDSKDADVAEVSQPSAANGVNAPMDKVNSGSSNGRTFSGSQGEFSPGGYSEGVGISGYTVPRPATSSSSVLSETCVANLMPEGVDWAAIAAEAHAKAVDSAPSARWNSLAQD